MMDHCGSITGVRDAEFDIDTSAGDKGLIEEILFQAAVCTASFETFGPVGIFSSDKEQMNSLRGGQNIGNLQGVRDNCQFPAGDLVGNKPCCSRIVQIDDLSGLDQGITFQCDGLFFLCFQNLSGGNIKVILDTIQDVRTAVGTDQLMFLFHGAQVTADGFAGYVHADCKVCNSNAFVFL